MTEQQYKTTLKETFDAVSAGYDGTALRFFPRSAENIAELLGLRGDERVLDVACGTGHASFAIASSLPKGRITAVDLSSGMLEQARKKAAALAVRNVEFIERDMQELGFPGPLFDAAVCAFGIFFVEDMDAQLARIAATVKSGGTVLITSFQEDYFQPLRTMFFARIETFGVRQPPPAWKRTADATGCRQLFEKAGLRNVRVETRNVGYHLSGREEWWDIVWNAGFRRLVTQLSRQDQERFKQEHLAEIATLQTDRGIWLDTGVLYTVGTKG